jgi:hypothetical protein
VGATTSKSTRNGKEQDSEMGKDEEEAQGIILSLQLHTNIIQELYNLRQVGRMEQYTEAFYQLLARVDLKESEEQLGAKYLSVLKPFIQDILVWHSLWTDSEAYNRALLGEKQQSWSVSRPGKQFQSYPKAGSASNMGKEGDLDERSARNDKVFTPPLNQPNASQVGAGKQPQGGGFKCFKCGEPSHRLAEC